ncbi:methyl-accepting chemotaxis protein [Pseudomonas sp. 20S_6.2_Bac1]|jgi:methyl-accepting chemotaxis protein|uniref:methyl-accepting chemotaxis protein n=1 Tax=Pseudomonas sp. 20S_6.2_Bac1 TaxID=2971618 RepID=UPI000C2FACC5|nr:MULTISPECIES: methyl-accepting chemotaxis protein [unclassified Pseudomonas]MCU1738967.1 methyl-accepting chemotaxis protein [Pseudomonas sp. 20S_6.2_Bac1]
MSVRNLKIATRAFLSFAFVTLLLIALGVLALWKMHLIREAAVDLQDNWMASLRQAGRVELTLYRIRLESFRLVSATDAQLKQAEATRIQELKATLDQQIKAYAPLVASPEEQAVYEAVQRNASLYEQKLAETLQIASEKGSEAALVLLNNVIPPLVGELQTNIEALEKINDDGAVQSGITAQQQFDGGFYLTIAIIVISCVLTVLLAIIFTRSLTGPLRLLLGSTRKIAEGDLRTEVQVDGKDELAELQASTAAMQASLKNTLRHISNSSTQLASAAEEMSAVTGESNRGIQRQSLETDQAATAVNEMTAAVEEVARNAVAASQSTQRSEVSTRTGADRVHRTIASIETLSSTVKATGQEVESLAQQAQNISKVLDVIRAIAEQTNLLALNAAIEAARAGEQGRGFAVVADEVRALAHRTQVSTQEIEQMIGAIQNGTGQAVVSMQRSNEEADKTLLIAHEAGSALSEIAQAISEINDRNLMIATASEEQAQVARSVDQNLISIRDLSIQSSSAASQTLAASHELSKLAVELNKVVTQFSI